MKRSAGVAPPATIADPASTMHSGSAIGDATPLYRSAAPAQSGARSSAARIGRICREKEETGYPLAHPARIWFATPTPGWKPDAKRQRARLDRRALPNASIVAI